MVSEGFRPNQSIKHSSAENREELHIDASVKEEAKKPAISFPLLLQPLEDQPVDRQPTAETSVLEGLRYPFQ
jgi:hypothetical protein